MLYATWSNESKNFESTYEKLAEHFTNIDFYKMDIIENEVDGIKVRQFPTLYFFSKNLKNPFIFEGDMSYENLKGIISEKIDAFKEEEL